MANAFEAASTSLNVRLKHGPHAGSEPQVGVPDDAFGDLWLTLLSCTRNVLRLTDRLQCVRSFSSVARLSLLIDGGSDVGAQGCVSAVLVREVRPPRPIVEVVVRVDDRQAWIEDRFCMQCEPVAANRKIVADTWLHRGKLSGLSEQTVNACRRAFLAKSRPSSGVGVHPTIPLTLCLQLGDYGRTLLSR